jgi:methylthioribose-1-phosphate isomerase
MSDNQHGVSAIRWSDHPAGGEGGTAALELLDQRILPQHCEYIRLSDARGVAQAIRDMVVRGAPAIGITAAYGVVLAARHHFTNNPSTWKQAIEADLTLLAESRPTAVNLFWALDQMRGLIGVIGNVDPVEVLLQEAIKIHQEDLEANMRMGAYGAELIQAGALQQGRCAVLTHCNAGALATGGYGTALGVIRSACELGLIEQVYADETRPWLQGSRLTAWELLQDHIPVTLIADGAAAYLMKSGKISWVIVGSDRIAANGDVANKIGTYSAAVAARYHGVKFMVAAPTSTIDMSLASGDEIPIESRAPDELLKVAGEQMAAIGSEAWNPVFDITPASLVDAIVTEKGVVIAPTTEKMAELMSRS